MASNSADTADDRRWRSPRGMGLILTIIVIWALLGFAAYECAEAALAALSYDYPQETAHQVRLGLALMALLAGVIFAALKLACQCIYGMVEVAVATVMAAEMAKTALTKEPLAALIGLAAIAYIVVCGLENTVKGCLVLQEKRRRGEMLLGPLAGEPKS